MIRVDNNYLFKLNLKDHGRSIMFTIQITVGIITGLYVYAFIKACRVRKAIQHTNETIAIAEKIGKQVKDKLDL
mgnify:CR=1 FL=1